VSRAFEESTDLPVGTGAVLGDSPWLNLGRLALL
jgi:hypothetical protein